MMEVGAARGVWVIDWQIEGVDWGRADVDGLTRIWGNCGGEEEFLGVVVCGG
jgi:hypothetical protein